MSKKITFLFLLISLSHSIFSQQRDSNYFLFGIGYTLQNSQQAGLNYVINSYNDTRQGKTLQDGSKQALATKALGKINTLSGFDIYAALKNKKLMQGEVLLEFMLGNVNGKSNAKVNVNGELSTRDLKLNLSNFSNTLSYIFLQETIIDMGIGGGYNLLYFNTSTRVDNDAYKAVNKGLTGGLTFSGLINFYPIKKTNLCLSLRPYYNVDLFNSDFRDLNKVINPGSYQFDESISQKGKFRNFGLAVNLCILVKSQN